jgi:transglutaminase-like putative cysteine protease
MLMRIPGLSAGSSVVCTRTFELTRWSQRLKPETKAQLVAVPADQARGQLQPSEGIESNHAEVRKFADVAIGEKSDAWDRVDALFQATRARVKYVEGPFGGALAGLRNGQGDCEERSCLFIASCRASGIPARVVWGPGHTWSEFALADPDGKWVWIPADPAKERELGVINHATPIFQKGDRFILPEIPGKPQRYLSPRCSGTGATPVLESIEEVQPLDGKPTKQ